MVELLGSGSSVANCESLAYSISNLFEPFTTAISTGAILRTQLKAARRHRQRAGTKLRLRYVGTEEDGAGSLLMPPYLP